MRKGPVNVKNQQRLSFCPEKYADFPADNGTSANLAQFSSFGVPQNDIAN